MDDEPLSVKILCHLLKNDYSVVVATSGEEALEIARSDASPDLILMDVIMPGKTGYDVCSELKRDPQTDGIPVILVTGLSEESDEKRGLDLGAVDYIQKPFSPSLVRARIRNQLELKKYRNHLEMLVVERTTELQLKQQQLAELNRELENRVAEEVNNSRKKDALLIHQDKLASVGYLAAGVAHEINNPMGFIMSNLKTLLNFTNTLQQYMDALHHSASDEQRAQTAELYADLDVPYIREELPILIAETLEGAERVKSIVLDLKDFACPGKDFMDETDLNRSVQRAANLYQSELSPIAQIELHLGDIPAVECNAQQINLVIANLLMNAAEAIDDHGTITITTHCEGDFVHIDVSDTGHGIADDIREHIFDPFFTTKDVGKGAGLGLSICYGIIKKHGGDIILDSQPGRGTTFTVKVPVNGII